MSRLALKVVSLAVFAAWGLLLDAVPAQAQRGRQQSNLERVLILPAVPANPEADSAFTIELADEMRGRLSGRVRNQVHVITTDQYCEALLASGFACEALLDDNSAEQLARFLRADSYITGRLSRNSAPGITLHMVDIGRSGIAGWVSVLGEAGQQAKDFANLVSDSLRNQVRVAQEARECSDRRDRSDFRGARERVDRAFQLYPNHPAAALCLAYVFEATQQPADSLIWAYEQAVRGDSLFERGWDRLGVLYLQAGDTVKAVEAYQSQLQSKPSNVQLRQSVAAMWIELDEFEKALSVVEAGLARTPEELSLLVYKARACVDGEMWACALEGLSAQYDLDTALVGDTVFYMQIIGAAGFVPDTAAALMWTGEAVQHTPNSAAFWTVRAQWLNNAGDKEAALDAYGRLTEMLPNDFRAPLSAAQILLDGLVIDSTVPLDTTAMAQADSLLMTAIDRAGGNAAVIQNVSVMYFTPGMNLARAQYRPDYALRWLEKALEYDVGQRLTAQGNFFLGFATFFYLQGFFEEVRNSQSCDMVNQYAAVVARGKEAMNLGMSVSEQGAQQILGGLQQYEDLVPAFRQNFECP
jgi:tetratricopeptide (TPR) repeat protein